MDYILLEEKVYEVPIKGFSMFSEEPVTIVGEKLVKNEDGELKELYVYDIDTYVPKNGKHFESLKCNIIII